jgi:iron complex outermembrane receptor protein
MTLRLPPSFLGIAAALWSASAGAQPAGDPAPFDPAAAAGGEAAAPDGEYLDPRVVTPGGQPSRVSESPSTTFVITAADIRRSGASSLPELLRRVPGLDVRSMTSMDGQLGLRGFAYEIADRVLVLVDGRTVYLDFFGGTAFDMLPVSLVDIERIEVVLGPGASVYGNKAMLGTINVITRSAEDYPFSEARLDAGPPGDGRGGARAAAIRGGWRVRATALGRRLTPFEPAGRHPGAAAGGTLSASYSPAAGDEVALEVGAMNGETYIIPTGSRVDRFDGTLGYARARARRGLGGVGAPLGHLNLDLVWNAGSLRSPTFPRGDEAFRATYHTPYAQAYHTLRTRLAGVPLHGRWGGEARLNTLDSSITSGEREVWNLAGFASGEVELHQDWRVVAGLRVDRSTLTDVSFSPRVSVIWSPFEHHQLRASYNTGYNNAHLLHYFADLELAPGLRLRGNPDLAAEHVRYGELGWAGWLTGWLRGFASAFVYRFADWISLDPRNAAPGVISYGNNAPLTAYGGEAGVEVTVRRSVSGYASWAILGPKGMGDYPYRLDPHGSPQHKASAGIRVEHRGGAYLGLDAQYFGRSAVARVTPASTAASPFEKTALSPYVMSHARVGYAFAGGLDLSLAATNVLDDRTRQFPGAEAPERRVGATLAYYR